MAIKDKSILVSNSREVSLRIKQRDYTIPVRLNQLQFINHKSRSRASLHLIRFERSNQLPCMHDKKLDTHQRTQPLMMMNLISTKHRRALFTWQTNLLVLIGMFLLILNTNHQVCQCDTSQSTKLNQRATSLALQSAPANTLGNLNNVAGGGLTENAINKQHLVSSLSDNIERQHFRVKPIKALVGHHQRPSKFDNGDGISEIDFVQMGSKKFASSAMPGKKADDGMRHILSMHEHAQRAASQRPSAARPNLVADSESIETGSHSMWPNKLREISKAPARVVSALTSPNKLVSQILSYISPLVGSKLNSDQPILGGLKFVTNQGASSKSPIVAASSSANNSWLALNLFSSRDTKQNPIGDNLLRFGRKFEPSSPSSSATQAPQTSYLVKPDLGFKSSNWYYKFQPTQPTTTFEANSAASPSSSALKSSVSDVSPPDDLMANESGSSIISMPANKPSKEENDEGSKVEEGSQSKSIKIQSASSWLKNNANQLAQNYIQNSFRDLLTLSQLPILSAGSISTAPSVLERPNRHRASSSGSKMSGNGTTSASQGQRTRAIDELYRYAYLLSTGLRHKRDPLVALGSGMPNPVLLNSKRSVFSQRPKDVQQSLGSDRDQLMLLNYIRGLKSILPTNGLKKAKPRGVMWDMATDPSLAVTVFHLLERASVALPLGFLLMPFVRMIRNPLNGFDLGRILPARASHRSVDYEELAKRLDIVDKMLSRALRPTHRESFIGK